MSGLRVMTYNIRHALGSDGRIDLARIAGVIAPFAPDILGLQEVDVHRARSGGIDQAHQLGERLGMTVRFSPTIERGTELYGIATLTRLPILQTSQVCLPRRQLREPRCALVTRLTWRGTELDLINTHLSTKLNERGEQLAALLAAFGNGLAATAIITGDFNCTPWSRSFRALCLTTAASPRSWPAWFPVVPIDHILFRGRLRVVRSGSWRGPGVRRASDHMPVVAVLETSPEPATMNR
jgi:endonuclease/exonuclease/phosphatase family metal-dependent hydrolase